ncbi:hydroxymethylbilane synthase [Megamonas funiformis]|uniref:hydroxymethylbilane synthase n=1 Tax=Megamonas funiformis TaxID=437897 RepID=UPI0024AD5032|nr:hydroxymethylbilane synthase [Megamonas funiformis]
MVRKKIVIGTRSSKLALWQAEYVADRLRKQYEGLEVELMHIVTKGDKILDVPLAKIGGKGLFTKELEVAMLEKRVDLAVHSLKDMPTVLPTGLSLNTITKRLDCGDALVSPKYQTLENLPKGAKVGTSSLRRKAQLLNIRPDLDIHNLRGNVNTRLRKLEEENFDAIVLAVAGLKRLGFGDKITQIIPRKYCLPAVGQGALAIETRADDEEIKNMLSFLYDDKTADATIAERAFLAQVEGGCQVPVGVYGEVNEDNTLTVEAVIGSLDGKTIIRDKVTGKRENASELGEDLAKKILANGGLEIMQSLGLCINK